MQVRHLFLMAIGLAIFGVPATWQLVPATAADLRVMSFNIRYGTANDGENHWDRRKEFLVETVQAFAPDLLGTQETLKFQRDYLREKFEVYDVSGVGRDDGLDAGEMMALYYRRDRFRRLDGGHFWLSETPEKIGSKSWDSSLPRMVTWVKLVDLQHDQKPPIVFFNTHFDHQGEVARLESSRLLRRQLTKLAEGCAVVITGDFNTDEGSAPYQALFQPEAMLDSPVIDTFRLVHPDRGPMEGTFSAFRSSETKGARIDWIGVSRHWKTIAASIDRTARDGRTPSDHFPVTAVLRWIE